jgi:hypothetical protein
MPAPERQNLIKKFTCKRAAAMVVSQLHGIPEWASRAKACLSTGFTPRAQSKCPDLK